MRALASHLTFQEVAFACTCTCRFYLISSLLRAECVFKRFAAVIFVSLLRSSLFGAILYCNIQSHPFNNLSLGSHKENLHFSLVQSNFPSRTNKVLMSLSLIKEVSFPYLHYKSISFELTAKAFLRQSAFKRRPYAGQIQFAALCY